MTNRKILSALMAVMLVLIFSVPMAMADPAFSGACDCKSCGDSCKCADGCKCGCSCRKDGGASSDA